VNIGGNYEIGRSVRPCVSPSLLRLAEICTLTSAFQLVPRSFEVALLLCQAATTFISFITTYMYQKP